MELFFADACPYAHRVRALLTLLGEPFESHVIDLSHKPADFLALSPTGAVPLFRDGSLILYESAVINEYLAERSQWRHAFSTEAGQRARERLAIKRFDDVVLPIMYQSFRTSTVLKEKPLWRAEVKELVSTSANSRPESLLGLHLATHWVRVLRAFPDNEVVSELAMGLGPFLAAAADLEAIVATNPNFEVTIPHLRAKFG
jgi:glutathione S-transferase